MDAPGPVGGRLSGGCVECIERCQREHPAAAAQAQAQQFASSSLVFPCFLRTVMEHNLRVNMAIPKAFVQQHARGLPGSTVDLEGVGGKVWLVRVVTATTGTAEFRFGWHVFAADNGLKTGDSVLFTMVAKNRFTVRVFNRTGIESSSASPPQIVPPQAQRTLSDSGDEVAEEAKILGGGDNQTVHEMIRAHERASEPNRRPPRRQPVSLEQAFASRRRAVTNAELASAVAASQKLVASIAAPSVAVVMTPSHVYRGFSLSIPSDFAREHLPHRSLRIELKDTWGHTWHANYDDHNGISWASFSKDHCLEEGDACVLELLAKHVFLVHICRVVDPAPTFVPGSRGPQGWDVTYSSTTVIAASSESSLPDLNEQLVPIDDNGHDHEPPQQKRKVLPIDDDGDDDDHHQPPQERKRKGLADTLRERVRNGQLRSFTTEQLQEDVKPDVLITRPKPEPEDVHSITTVKDEPMYNLVKAEDELERAEERMPGSEVKVEEMEMGSVSGSPVAVYSRRPRKPEGDESRMWHPVVRMLGKRQREGEAAGSKDILVEVLGTVMSEKVDERVEQVGPGQDGIVTWWVPISHFSADLSSCYFRQLAG